MENMKPRKDEICQLIEDIEKRKKRITPDDIKKYVKRYGSDESREEDMISDVQRVVNRKFNAEEMFDKIDDLVILEEHIAYLYSIHGVFDDMLTLLIKRPYNYFYYSINSIMAILLILLMINVFYFIPHYANSDSEILKTINSYSHVNANHQLEIMNADNISLIETTIISNLVKVVKKISPFSKDFLKLRDKNNKILSSIEIKSLISKNFTNISMSKEVLQLFIKEDQRIRQQYINYLMSVYYLKYPNHKYLAINNHLEYLIKQKIIGEENYTEVETDMHETIDNHIQVFKNKDILDMTKPYNKIKSTSILDYTIIGFIVGVGGSIAEEKRFKDDILNKLINTRNKIINGTKTDIGLSNKLRKLQLRHSLSKA